MRHGNVNKRFGIYVNLCIGSDPTYEAWKPTNRANSFDIIVSRSDPTYEAWKQIKGGNKMSKKTEVPILPMRHGNCPGFFEWLFAWGCSDPTYEAWKLLFGFHLALRKNEVPILPMRHGNFSYPHTGHLALKCSDPTYEAWKQDMGQRRALWRGSFRSYLWGMETIYLNKNTSSEIVFRSYLWGMETWKFCSRKVIPSSVPILPMRHGNHSWYKPFQY